MNYLRGVGSLEDRAAIKVAINVCQSTDFKETVLCLHKSKFEFFTNELRKSDEKLLELWDKSVDDYVEKVTKELPLLIKHNVQRWINRIALEYLSYCRRQEVLFGVGRFIMMNFVTEKDWTESGQLNEIKLANRLLHDSSLTAFQRYHIMCYYCLHTDSMLPMAPKLWGQLSSEEKYSIVTYPSLDVLRSNSGWSRSALMRCIYQTCVLPSNLLVNSTLLQHAIKLAISDGNRFALMSNWKCLSYSVKQSKIMGMVVKAFDEWESTECNLNSYRPHYNDWRKKLVSNKSSSDVRQYNLPFYSRDVLFFFLSEMNEQQQRCFFGWLFKKKRDANILKIFLDWPYQEYFLPMMRKLWDILPKYNYADCLLILAGKYGGFYNCKDAWSSTYWEGQYWMEDHFYDYRKLLSKLWDETPLDYKYYVFTDKLPPYGHREVKNEGRILLPRLLQRCPFVGKDEELFKSFLRWVRFEERLKLMYSESGIEMCSSLALNGKWTFADWLLEGCLSKDKIAEFKKNFIQSYCGLRLSIHLLNRDRETLLRDLIDWCFKLDEDKKKFKVNLLYKIYWMQGNELILRDNNISEIERMMNFCLPSKEETKRFKLKITEYSCEILMKCLACDELNRILTWCFNSREKIRTFKEKMLTSGSIIKIHCDFIFDDRWEYSLRLYEWFDLSSQAIEKLKKDTALSDYYIRRTVKLLEDDFASIFPVLGYCLIDPETIITFSEKFKNSVISSSYRISTRIAIVYQYLGDLQQALNEKHSIVFREYVVPSKRVKLE